jgi:hypothetical protein
MFVKRRVLSEDSFMEGEVVLCGLRGAVDPEYYVFNVKLADYLGFLISVTFITDIFRPNAVPFASDCLPRQTNVY